MLPFRGNDRRNTGILGLSAITGRDRWDFPVRPIGDIADAAPGSLEWGFITPNRMI